MKNIFTFAFQIYKIIKSGDGEPNNIFMSVKAKFRCNSIEEHKDNDGTITGKSIRMSAVVAYGEDGTRNDENESWSKWTPSGDLVIYITNPDAFNQFEEKKQYYLTFEEVA